MILGKQKFLQNLYQHIILLLMSHQSSNFKDKVRWPKNLWTTQELETIKRDTWFLYYWLWGHSNSQKCKIIFISKVINT